MSSSIFPESRLQKIISILAVALFFIGIIWIAKPFNKSNVNSSSSDYKLNVSGVSAEHIGYYTDYNGLIFTEVKSNQKHGFDAEFIAKNDLKLTFTLQEGEGEVAVLINASLKDSFSIDSKSDKTIVNLPIRANDYLNVVYKNSGATNLKVDCKIQHSNRKYQLQFYLVCLCSLIFFFIAIFLFPARLMRLPLLVGFLLLWAEESYTSVLEPMDIFLVMQLVVLLWLSSTSLRQLPTSLRQLTTSLRQLPTSLRQLPTSLRQLKASLRQLKASLRQLKASLRQPNELKQPTNSNAQNSNDVLSGGPAKQLSSNWLGIIVRFVFDVLYLVISLFAFCFIGHEMLYDKAISVDVFMAAFQTNLKEVTEFAWTTLPSYALFGLFIFILLPIVGLFKKHQISERKNFKIRTAICILIVPNLLLHLSHLESITDFFSARSTYFEELEKFNEVQQDLKAGKQKVTAFKPSSGDKNNQSPETYIVIIGESLSKNHMSAYEYHAKTTPNIEALKDSDNFVLFPEAYSCHTHTIPVLQKALTACNQYNSISFFNAPSLVNVFNAADFETIWLSNQVRLSNWDNMVSAVAMACDQKIYLNKNVGQFTNSSPYDEVLLDPLDKILNTKTNKNRVIFIHLMGNHSNYAKRYPPHFKSFTKENIQYKVKYGAQLKPFTPVDYDNSVAYNDSIVGEIFDRVSMRKNRVVLAVYFSDHGEDIRENRGHNSNQFSHEMVEIPFMVFWSERYENRYPKKTSLLETNKSKPFTNDALFDLMIGLTNVETEHYDPKLDQSSEQFEFPELKIMDGREDLVSPENKIRNTRNFINKDSALYGARKLGIHRTNTLGKLFEVKNLGFALHEMDVVVRNEASKFWLEVGHGENGSMTELDLAEWLKKANLDFTDKIWLDIKNVDSADVKPLVKYLNRLSSILPKENLIVETSCSKREVRFLSLAGYRVSYYIPTYYADISVQQKKLELAQLIRKISREQQLTYLSFDPRLYTWVKNDVSVGLSGGVKYLSWLTDIDITDYNAHDLLENSELFTNNRIETLLIKYTSKFEI